MRWSKRRKQRHGSGDGGVDDGLLLHRICDVMLKAVKTGRPLIHLIKAWAIVGPHLIEVVLNSSPHDGFVILVLLKKTVNPHENEIL